LHLRRFCAVVVNWAHADARLRYWLGGRIDDGKTFFKKHASKKLGKIDNSSYSKCIEELRKWMKMITDLKTIIEEV
jgi:hypothetical protein